MTLCDEINSYICEGSKKFKLIRDIEDVDGEIIPKGTIVKIKRVTKHGSIRDFTITSPDGLEGVISMPLKKAIKLGIAK